MSKFCMHCGRPLEEGQLCNCQNKSIPNEAVSTPLPVETPKTEVKSAPAPTVNSAPGPQAKLTSGGFGQYIIKMFKYSLEFAKKPSDCIKKIAKDEDYKAGLFFFALQIIISAFLFLIIMKIASNALGLFGSFFNFGFFGQPYGGSLIAPVMSIVYIFLTFISTILLLILQFFLLAGVIFGIGKVLKATGTFKAIIAVLGVASIPITASIIAALFVALIFPTLAVYILWFGAITTILLNFIGIKEALKVDENINIYIVPIAYLVYLFIMLSILNSSVRTSIW